jgi:hypothetical protein
MPSMSMMSLVLFFCEAGIRVILGNLWMNVLVILDSFPIDKYQHVNRRANRGEHVLAQVGIKQVIDIFWIEKTSQCICDIILEEQLFCL